MSFDFSTLITDRQKSDVEYARALIGRITNGAATEEELAEWNSATLKGAYDYTDLNRVTSAMDEINSMLSAAGYKTGYSKNGDPKPLLPNGYTQLEYVESTGTQYINSEFNPNQNTRVFLKVNCGPPTSFTSVFGAEEAWGVKSFSFGANTATFGTKGISTLNYNDSQIHIVDFDKGNLKVDENQIVNWSGTFQFNFPLFVLANNGNNTNVYYSAAKLYFCKIYDNGLLIRDFVPCKNSSEEIGLYDLVSETFFGNDGTGSFIAGPVVEEFGEATEILPEVWLETDTPNLQQINQYLSNVKALRSTIENSSPDVPKIQDIFTVDAANNIEKILLGIEHAIQTMKQTYVPCGTTACGGDYF